MIKTIVHKRADLAPLVARLIIGGIFIYAGWMKVGDMPGTIAMFGQLGLPAWLTYVVSYGELLGGLLLVLGAWFDRVALFLSVIMIVAAWLTRAGGMAAVGLPLATLAGLLALLGSGPGRYTVRKR